MSHTSILADDQTIHNYILKLYPLFFLTKNRRNYMAHLTK